MRLSFYLYSKVLNYYTENWSFLLEFLNFFPYSPSIALRLVV